MHQDEELHAELMKVFREYFELNQRWMSTGTKRACIDTRNCLSEIRRICSKRRVVLQEWRMWKNEDMKATKALKAAQKGKGTGAGDDN